MTMMIIAIDTKIMLTFTVKKVQILIIIKNSLMNLTLKLFMILETSTDYSTIRHINCHC